MNDDSSLTEEELALHIRLRGLRREHADLDAAIEALGATAVPDQLRIAPLKRQKLASSPTSSPEGSAAPRLA